jgi:hypothetical protein
MHPVPLGIRYGQRDQMPHLLTSGTVHILLVNCLFQAEQGLYLQCLPSRLLSGLPILEPLWEVISLWGVCSQSIRGFLDYYDTLLPKNEIHL